MVTINIYVTIKGTSRIWLSIDVPKEMAGEEGTKYVALAIADKRVEDSWWDFVDSHSPDPGE